MTRGEILRRSSVPPIGKVGNKCSESDMNPLLHLEQQTLFRSTRLLLCWNPGLENFPQLNNVVAHGYPMLSQGVNSGVKRRSSCPTRCPQGFFFLTFPPFFRIVRKPGKRALSKQSEGNCPGNDLASPIG